jgi:hypothetical protein
MGYAVGMAAGTMALTLILNVVPASAAEWTPVAHWRMDEASGTTMADAVADHTGTTSDVKTGLPGRVRSAYGFDGEVSYALVPSADALNPGDRDIRISLWIKTGDRPESPDWDLVKKGYAAESPGHYKVEYQPDGRASCGFAGTEGSTAATGGPDLADGSWHQVSCTKTATSITLAVDGQPVATEDAPIGEISNTNDLVLGAYRGPTDSGHFLGSIDEVTIEMADGSSQRDPKRGRGRLSWVSLSLGAPPPTR